MECPSLLPNKGQQTSQGKQNCQEPCHVVPWCVPGTPTMSGLLPRSSVVVTWKAGCGESRTSGLEWGKDREVLPITTGEVVIPPCYPALALSWFGGTRNAVLQRSAFRTVSATNAPSSAPNQKFS